MKLFGRTGGYYLFWSGAVYLIGGLCLLSTEWREYSGFVAPIWILILMLPFVFPPLGRWLNMSIDWDKNMFDWLKGRTAKDYLDDASNVYKLPTPKLVPPMPEVEEPAKILYRVGITDNNKVSFSMGYKEVVMTKVGCQNMIDQITVFMNQLEDDE